MKALAREAMAAALRATEVARSQSARRCGTAVGRATHRGIDPLPRNP
jgi:hypothetical protein